MNYANEGRVDANNKGRPCMLGAGVRHESYIGLKGHVEKAIKSRNVYAVRLEDGRLYDAIPNNVVLLPTAA
jgi:hypothetical protein